MFWDKLLSKRFLGLEKGGKVKLETGEKIC
jgi:hypothetical protein